VQYSIEGKTKMFDRWFLLGQLFLWFAVALITRFSWIATYPPSWLWITCYVTLGFSTSVMLVPLLKSIQIRTILQQCIYSLGIAIFAGLLWRVMFNILEYHVLESTNNQFQFWGYFHNGKSAVTQMILWVCGYWGVYYYRHYRHQQQRTEIAELETKAAQLALLQYQINPHFLFNILGNLDTLLLKKDNEKARKMLNQLTRYLRSSLENDPKETVSLTDEIKQIKSYLDIETIRFGNRLQIEWSLPMTLPNIQLPNGILLPIIENAIKHGDISSAKGGILNINISTTKRTSIVTISNGYSMTNRKAGFGIGLKNTQQRLKTFYRGLASLSIDSDQEHYCVTMALPNE